VGERGLQRGEDAGVADAGAQAEVVGQALFFAEAGQQEMFRADVFVAEALGFLDGEARDAFAPLTPARCGTPKGLSIPGVQCRHILRVAFDMSPEARQIDTEVGEGCRGKVIFLTQKAQRNVGGTDRGVPSGRFLVGKGKGPVSAFCVLDIWRRR
jgi:hypothetical protein